MPFVVTCIFREPVKSYHLDPGELDLSVNTPVIGETSRGVELGRVKFRAREMAETSIVPPLRRVLRVATQSDLLQDAENQEREAEALQLIRDRIVYYDLPMKPIKTELLFDRSKLFFHYESEVRVDFRDLLRDLSSRLDMRMQFHQVTAREAAGLLGGVGPCGRELCCSTFLTVMPPVTLKMAKEQSLSLTPSKISGACGRLMCCLRYEIDFYRDQSQRLPRPGAPVDSPEGPGRVIDVNMLSEQCIIELGDGRRITVDGDTLRALREERGPVRSCNNHVKNGGTCGGADAKSDGQSGCGGSCGTGGGCGCSSGAAKAKTKATSPMLAGASA